MSKIFEKDYPGFKTEGFAVAVMIMVGAILRGWRVFLAPPWYDEAFTVVLARLPFIQMIQATRGDVHPPLYYALVSALDGVYIRAFSVVCSVVALFVFWLVLRRLGMGTGGRLLALALLAFSEPQLWYAGEARMYAWMELLVLSIWLAILTRRWWVMGVLSALLLYTHNYAPLYLAVLAMVALFGELRRPRHFYVPPAVDNGQPEGYGQSENVIRSFLAAGLVYLPWFMWGQVAQLTGMGGHWTQAASGVVQLSNLQAVIFGRFQPGGLQIIAILVMAGGLALLPRWAVRNHRAGVLALALGPVVLMALISVLWKPVWLPRGMLAAMPALYALIADSIATAPIQRRLVLIGVIGPLFFTSTIAHIGMVSVGQVKFDPLAYRVDLNITPGVPVVHNSDFSLVTWAAVFGTDNQYLIGSDCQPEPGSLSTLTRQAMGLETIQTLPEDYYLVGTLSGLSNSCQEAELERITATAAPVIVEPGRFGITGVWSVQHGN